MARSLRIEFLGALYHVMLRTSEQSRIVRHDANRQKWIEWLPRTVKTCGWRERRQPRGTPHGHGPAQLSRTANASSPTPIHYSRPDPKRHQRHFDFGATVVVFNTGATNRELAGRLDDAVWGEEAIQAYRDYLALRLQ